MSAKPLCQVLVSISSPCCLPIPVAACLFGGVRDNPAVLWGLNNPVLYPSSCSRYPGERLLLPGGARMLHSVWRSGVPQLSAALSFLSEPQHHSLMD
ncbi:hypothetical protein I79_008784 [Cricetulus griseus]|uniref:Uncharacterized protein n=1 Tax=Cricetulus griseus TaxID=10029 RepID=G3HE15_CRIGR|nr:hypothetical protein I79_008784 [Cricetulus griseus]